MILSACDSGLFCCALGRFAPLPHLADDRRQAVPAARETRAEKARHRVAIVGIAHAFHQSDRIDQKRADDRRIQALVVEHQHRIVEAGLRIHHEAAGTRAPAAHRRDSARRSPARCIRGMYRCVNAATEPPLRSAASPVTVARSSRKVSNSVFAKMRRDQFAVLQVVARECGLVFSEAAIDLVHPLIRVVDRLAFAQQRLRDVFEAERRKAPGRGFQRFDAVDDQPSRRRREEMILLEPVFAPFHRRRRRGRDAAATRYRSRVLLQHAQIELHEIPADDRIGIVPLRSTSIELLQQLRAACRSIRGRSRRALVVAVRRPEHIDLPLPASFERDGVQLAVRAGFDIERHQLRGADDSRARASFRRRAADRRRSACR